MYICIFNADVAGSWNLSYMGKQAPINPACIVIVNTIIADNQVMQGTRASAAMGLAKLYHGYLNLKWNIPDICLQTPT